MTPDLSVPGFWENINQTGNKSPMSETQSKAPLQITFIGWFGIVLAAMYLILGVVNIILSILDRTYKGFGENAVFILYGCVILIPSIGFKNLQKWGWYSYLAVIALIFIWSLLKFWDAYYIVLGLLSMVALIGILMPSVRKHYVGS
jgi:hypothetical protein